MQLISLALGVLLVLGLAGVLRFVVFPKKPKTACSDDRPKQSGG